MGHSNAMKYYIIIKPILYIIYRLKYCILYSWLRYWTLSHLSFTHNSVIKIVASKETYWPLLIPQSSPQYDIWYPYIMGHNTACYIWLVQLCHINTLIDAEIKGPPCSRRHFSNTFSWMKMYVFRLNFHAVCSQGSNEWYSSIGSDNGLSPTRRQTIIWTSDG